MDNTEMTFGAWVKSKARARGEAGVLVNAIRADKGITEKTPLKSAEKKFGTHEHFPVLVNRFNSFLGVKPAAKKAAKAPAKKTEKAAKAA